MNYEMDFIGKVVIVTGGASGIGKATALAFAQNGASVSILDKDREGAINVAQQIRIQGGDCCWAQVDTANIQQVQRATRETLERFDHIDILVNNAGIEFNDRGNIVTMPYPDMERILQVNLLGYIHMARSTIPHMEWGGKVVNVSSLQAFGAHLPGTSYQVAKAGILGLTRALAIEYAPHGINVNAVAPGPIATEGMGKVRGGQSSIDAYRKKIPQGRRGRPEEVAGPILFLASHLASYMSGAVLVVDGGESINLTPAFDGEFVPNRDDPDV